MDIDHVHIIFVLLIIPNLTESSLDLQFNVINHSTTHARFINTCLIFVWILLLSRLINQSRYIRSAVNTDPCYRRRSVCCVFGMLRWLKIAAWWSQVTLTEVMRYTVAVSELLHLPISLSPLSVFLPLMLFTRYLLGCLLRRSAGRGRNIDFRHQRQLNFRG